MNMKKLIVPLALALGVAVVGWPDAMAQTKESKITRSGSTSSLRVTDMRAVKRNGLLYVQATFINDSSFETDFNYRIKWLDDSGFKVADDEVWKPKVVFAGQSFDITAIAPTPQATDFQIDLNGSR